jgi:uncharacterized protein with NRDE domain
MCTLIALHRCTPAAPLVIAANRDEYLERPSEGPALRAGGAHPVAAPRDLRAGGTWLGVNAEGLLAAVTNRPVSRRDDRCGSRGQVVLEALEARSAREVAESLSGLGRDRFNPFNLLVADGQEAFTVVYEGRAELEELSPGAHVIGNADPDDRAVPKIARLLDEAQEACELEGSALWSALATTLRGHAGEPAPLAHTCIHAGGYGTRSSTLLQLGPGAEPVWWYADGPPCRTPYEDFSFLLHQLDRGGELPAGDATTRSMT